MVRALLFDRAGYRVAAYGRDEAALDDLRTLLQPGAVVNCLDTQDADALATRLVELAEHTDGRLELLINIAGVLSAGRFAEI